MSGQGERVSNMTRSGVAIARTRNRLQPRMAKSPS